MAAPNRRGIKRWFCLTYLSLSVAYTRPAGLTREQRGTGRHRYTYRAHVTLDADTTFKVTRPLWLVDVLAGHDTRTVMATCPYAYMTYRVTTCMPGRGHLVAAARPQLVLLCVCPQRYALYSYAWHDIAYLYWKSCYSQTIPPILGGQPTRPCTRW